MIKTVDSAIHLKPQIGFIKNGTKNYLLRMKSLID
jgi:hypothetical protein